VFREESPDLLTSLWRRLQASGPVNVATPTSEPRRKQERAGVMSGAQQRATSSKQANHLDPTASSKEATTRKHKLNHH
jgi:hypothetical protein